MYQRLPFDALTLRAVCTEIQPAVGANLRTLSQPDENTVCLVLAKHKTRHLILISSHPTFFRAHLSAIEPSGQDTLGHFATTTKRTLQGGKVLSMRQHGFDRILLIEIGKAGGIWTLAAHLTGTNSNLYLVNPAYKVQARLRNTGKLRPNSGYALPQSSTDLEIALQTRQSLSPLLHKQLDLLGADELIRRFQNGPPVLIPGIGAYPFQPEGLPLGRPMSSMSIALEQFYLSFQPKLLLEEKRKTLKKQLSRALQSRDMAFAAIQDAIAEAERSREVQLFGELILANLASIKQGDEILHTQDYEGNVVNIPLDPTLTPLENADHCFQKAKKAKSGRRRLEQALTAIRAELDNLRSLLALVDDADQKQLAVLADRARQEGFLREPKLPVTTKKDRPFEGHKIGTAQSSAGYTVLWGQTAAANDYLTTRVARPNDIWLHVRGHTSAHVIIQTDNNPQRVQRDTIMFAAAIAARNSNQKHSKHITVDYTLAKYVRKPKGSPVGTANYIREKSIVVELT